MANFNVCKVDLSDSRVKGFVNRGYGMLPDGVSKTAAGIEFENFYDGEGYYPMYAVDFSEYVQSEGIDLNQVESVEIVISIYDAVGDEIDISDQHQKVAFVSADAIDGYSDSDILPSGNYKQIGSNIVTKCDLTTYNGYMADGITLTAASLEDGAGFNIQLVNGEITSLCNLKVTHLQFNMKGSQSATTEESAPAPTQASVLKEEVPAFEGKELVADLNDSKIKAYVNNGQGIVEDGVSHSGFGITIAMGAKVPYPMFAVDFSEYLAAKGVKIQDVATIEVVAVPLNNDGDELPLTDEFQKCCFVSRKALNGYSQSDILATGNYKCIGSQEKTKFDLTKYDSSTTNSSVTSELEEGVGFNIQIVNGDYQDMQYLIVSSLVFTMK